MLQALINIVWSIKIKAKSFWISCYNHIFFHDHNEYNAYNDYCAFNFFPNGEYSNLFIVAAFSNKSLSGKTFLSVENSYLQTFPDDKTDILAACLPKLY